MDYSLQEKGALKFVSFPHLPVPHGCSTRLGGVSKGPLASLNLGYTAGDKPERVDQNRRLFQEALGVAHMPWTLSMNHGTEVALIDHDNGFPRSGGERSVGDACITESPGVTLSITTADCVPLLFYDPARPAVGLAHAGWRGTVAGIAGKTVNAMRQRFGSKPEELQVAVGPAIGPERFLVHQDVAQPFRERFPGMDLLRAAGERWSVDLWEANRHILLEHGVLETHLKVCRLCTSTREDLFFSYRRDQGETGRLATAISLHGGG